MPSDGYWAAVRTSNGLNLGRGSSCVLTDSHSDPPAQRRSGCVEQICTGQQSYKAQLSPPLLLLCFAARESQERFSAERAPKHGYNAAGDRDCGKVCEVSGSIASLAVSRPVTAGDQPTTEQPAAAADDAGRQAGTDCYEAKAT
ncbi:unnamed protein product [Pleuronectes platessa]|uniref:Uncharacterized protein n=1 Tax=Pleuronectes platessa TaxID=8262 RepID=A0A9N7YLJ1_PLEPL|nr:unnamed protein product [Pleuronectes platessa]